MTIPVNLILSPISENIIADEIQPFMTTSDNIRNLGTVIFLKIIYYSIVLSYVSIVGPYSLAVLPNVHATAPFAVSVSSITGTPKTVFFPVL